MAATLKPISIESVYFTKGPDQRRRVNLPARMSYATPDLEKALRAIASDVESRGGHIYLSDLFRSHDMQLQAHRAFVEGRKSAYSPPPGSSMHEAGRAFDMDLTVLTAIKMPLSQFWQMAAAHGVVPIISTPNSSLSEAWHFECRGSHSLVKAYYEAGNANNMKSYEAMTVSAIASVGIDVDRFVGKMTEVRIQSHLIRLGKNIGNIDGDIGFRCRNALTALGVSGEPLEMEKALELQIMRMFPSEF